MKRWGEILQKEIPEEVLKALETGLSTAHRLEDAGRKFYETV